MKKELKIRLVTQCGCEKQMTIFVDDDEIPSIIMRTLTQSITCSYDEYKFPEPVRTRTFRLSSVSGPNHPWIYYEEPDGQQ